MKTAYLMLIAASSFCFASSAYAKYTFSSQLQQNNSPKSGNNVQVTPRTDECQPAHTKVSNKKSDRKKVASQKEHPIDIVICLDTSSSMNGLIDSAKQKIWDIVNELATAKPKPHLRVGLYAYGTPSYGSGTGFVQKELDLTDDLDKVFTELTALRTNGGDEYCGRVISAATNEQTWDTGKKALKIIVVAGNESATQDPKINVFDAAKTAISRGIIVNTIYCGSPMHRDATAWRQVSTSADGQFAAIDQNRTIVMSTPFDQRLAELGGRINATYVAYGKDGTYGQQRQIVADQKSLQLGPSNFAARAAAKISGQYRNSSWDLLDASNEKDFNLSKIKKQDLPAEMQSMSTGQQKAFLEQKAKERADIQKQIADLNTQRSQFIQEALKKSGNSNDKAFDTAMLRALREQAQRNGFTFETK